MYKIKFTHNIPSYDSLSYEKTGTNESYHDLYILMKVYIGRKLIYSIKINMEGHYYCCGSRNFEYQKVVKTVIKECNADILTNILNELNNKYSDVFKNSVLKNWTSNIFKELCE